MSVSLLREPRAAYRAGPRERLAEADLFRLWEGQRFPKGALVTADGRPLRVVFRGMAGAGPGPDFRGAIIAAPEGLLQGDVELHVRTSDFRRHGHHLDPAYGGVVLHVVFFHDEAGETALSGGGRAPVLALGGPRAAGWLSRPARWGEPCREAVGRAGAESVGETLDRLGGMRFRQKAAAWRKRLDGGVGVEEALWPGLLEALAYGGEREAFGEIALAVPWAALRAELLALPEGARAACARERLGAAYELLRRHGPRRAGLRPGNGPGRRLEGAAALAARLAGPGLAAALIGPLAEADRAALEIVRVLTVPRLVGRGRALEIAANAVLPMAAALCGEEGTRAIEAVYARLSLPARYGAVGHLHRAVGAQVPVTMRRQQGMLYLLRQYCTQGGCGKCPLS